MNRVSLERLANTARAMKAAILLISALLAIGSIYVVFALVADPSLQTELIRNHVTGPNIPVTLDATALTGLCLIATINLTLILYGLACVWRFASLIRAGRIFSLQSGNCLRRTGAVALVGAASMVVSRLLAVLIATVGNPPGQKVLIIGFGTNEAFLLLLAALLFGIGHAMVLAAEIDAENRNFI